MIVKELVAKLGLDIDELGFEKAEAVFHKLHLGFVAFGAAAVSAIALGAAAIAQGTASAALQANRLAQMSGTDLETFQKLGFAAGGSKENMEDLSRAMQHLARTGVKNVSQGMLDLADRFKSMPTDGNKLKLAFEKFGRAGAGMIPFLNKGKEAITELMDEAEDLGLVFNQEDVKAAKGFKHAIHIIEATFQGLGYTIGKTVLPLVTKFAKAIEHILVDIRKGEPWVKNLTLAFKTLGFVLGGALLAAVAANIGAIATAVSWYIVLGIQSTIAGLKAAASWALAAAPVVLLIAAFTGLLLILDDVRGYLDGEKSLIGELGPKWSAFLNDFMAVDGDEPWWLVATKLWIGQLRAAMALVQDIEGTFNGLAQAVGFQGGRDSGRGEVATQAEIDAKQQAFFHGGAASNLAGQRHPQAANATTVHAPVVVNVHGAGDPKAIGDHVVRTIREEHDKTMRHAAAGIQ